MDPLLKMVILLCIQAGTAWAAECNDPCFCSGEKIVICFYRDLTQLPPGYWPEVTTLTLRFNHISDLHMSSLTGFPNVNAIDLRNNMLTELDLEVFSVVPFLTSLDVDNNDITTIVAAPSGVKLASLDILSLHGNRISSLDPNALQAAPNLKRLSLKENPLTAEQKEPFLNQPMLECLDISDTLVSFQSLSSDFFKGLPKLGSITLNNLNLANISGAFVSNPNLYFIGLLNNQISEVTAGTFAPSDSLRDLHLLHNPLQRLDVAAVEDAVPSGGYIYIDYTPLACSCGYESLYWWAMGKGVHLYATCTDKEPCSFVRKTNVTLIQENDD